MYVLADLEWVENKDKRRSFTQIAMVRVDENWQPLQNFYSRIRPRDSSFYQWDHMAFSGGSQEDFLNAPDTLHVFSDVTKWLRPDDEICWWSADSMDRFRNWIPGIRNKQLVLAERIANYLQEYHGISPYCLAKRLFLRKPLPKHDSRNDVEMMRSLLHHIHFPHPVPPYISKTWESDPTFSKNLVYTADIETNKIHKKGCSRIPENGDLRSYFELTRPVGKGYIPCGCVKDEFRAAMRQRNQLIIDRSEYNFLYSPDSEVFHLRKCKIMLAAREIKGTVRYRTCLETGRYPCRICNPMPEHDPGFHVRATELTQAEQRAVNRLKQAQQERNAISQKQGLTKTQRDALYTLSQPGYAFFAAEGYDSFHLRNCKKLSGLADLQGFAHYDHALEEGYRPCKYCKPTDAHDVFVSLPIFTKERDNDSPRLLRSLCVQHRIRFWRESDLFYMETAVGIWRIDTGSTPYRLAHINLLKEPENRTDFHRQPRLFLSLKDAFYYIKRHDQKTSNQETIE